MYAGGFWPEDARSLGYRTGTSNNTNKEKRKADSSITGIGEVKMGRQNTALFTGRDTSTLDHEEC